MRRRISSCGINVLAKMATERSKCSRYQPNRIDDYSFIFIPISYWCSRWSPDTSENGDRALKVAQGTSQIGLMIALFSSLSPVDARDDLQILAKMATECSKLLKVPAKSVWWLLFIFISFIIIILAYFYCAAYTGMKVIESPTNCDRRCITKLINSHRWVWIDGFSDAIWKFCP